MCGSVSFEMEKALLARAKSVNLSAGWKFLHLPASSSLALFLPAVPTGQEQVSLIPQRHEISKGQ